MQGVGRCAMAAVLLTGLLVGCGEDDEPYAGARACGVDPARIEAVVNTDRFTISGDNDLQPLSSDQGESVCAVRVGGEKVFVIHTQLMVMDTNDPTRAQLKHASGRFDYAGGTGWVMADQQPWVGVWVCGDYAWVQVRAFDDDAADVAPTPDELRRLLEGVADRAGCAPDVRPQQG